MKRRSRERMGWMTRSHKCATLFKTHIGANAKSWQRKLASPMQPRSLGGVIRSISPTSQGGSLSPSRRGSVGLPKVSGQPLWRDFPNSCLLIWARNTAIRKRGKQITEVSEKYSGIRGRLTEETVPGCIREQVPVPLKKTDYHECVFHLAQLALTCSHRCAFL